MYVCFFCRATKVVLTAILRASDQPGRSDVRSCLQMRCIGGMTALHTACFFRSSRLLRLLGEGGVDVFALDDCGRSCAHYVACTIRSVSSSVPSEPTDECVPSARDCALWISQAAPELLDMPDTAGNTPLHTAAENGYEPGWPQRFVVADLMSFLVQAP